MATQGATLDRQGHVPIWPIAALVAVAIAIAVTAFAVQLANDVPAAGPVTVEETVESTDGFGPRGATGDAMLRQKAIEAWSARIHELPAGPFHEEGRAHEAMVITRGMGG